MLSLSLFKIFLTLKIIPQYYCLLHLHCCYDAYLTLFTLEKEKKSRKKHEQTEIDMDVERMKIVIVPFLFS